MPALIRYHGGKVRMAPKMASIMPTHHTYVEPYGGGAAALLQKSRAKLEVYNDLDGEMVNLFRVLRDHGDALSHAIALTPFARAEHKQAYQASDDPVERARRTLVKSHFGHGSNGINRSTGFRSAGLRAGVLPVHCWAAMPPVVRHVAERMRGVVIENRPAIQVMQAHDDEGTLHYVDPPYLPETRGPGADYKHEMTPDDHAELLECVLRLKGRVLLSGYASDLYDAALTSWRRIEIKARADRAAARTEVVWANFDDAAPLFAAAQTPR